MDSAVLYNFEVIKKIKQLQTTYNFIFFIQI